MNENINVFMYGDLEKHFENMITMMMMMITLMF